MSYQDELRYDLEGRLDWEIARGRNFRFDIYTTRKIALVLPQLQGSRDQGLNQETILGYKMSWEKNGVAIESGIRDWKSSGSSTSIYYLSHEIIDYHGRNSEPWAKISALWMPDDSVSVLPALKYSSVADENRFDPGLNVGWQPVQGLMFYAQGASTYHHFLPREQK